MVHKFNLLAILFCVCITTTSAQTTTGVNFKSEAISQFKRWEQIPYEKLYLHLDKPYYSAGENIWLSSYLVDGMTTKLSPYSKFIYVELIDKGDSIKARYKVRKDSLGLNGNMPLPADLTPGDYHLRAYSWWMQNAGPDYFFQQNIHIGNAIDKSIQSAVTYHQATDKQINTDITFTSDEHISFANRKVDYKIYKGGKMIRTRSATIDAQGHLQFGIDFDPESNDQYSIQIAFNDPSYAYKRTFFVPSYKSSFDVQFFPEGGHLLNNGFRNIAFKALGNNGLSVEVDGAVFNQKGDTVATFSSEHKGMGSCSIFLPDTITGKYSAKARIKGTLLYKPFDFPVAVNQGFGLKMMVYNSKVRYEIFSGHNSHQTNTFYLMAQERGKLIFVLPIADSLQWHGNIATDKFSPGIVHFLLLDQNGNALSQRLVFINRPLSDPMSIKNDKEVYAVRQPVNLSVNFENSADSSAIGKFSVSVTEDRSVKLDSLSNNISSNLLLTSDLKGMIEDPAYYLQKSAIVERHADLLMQTHGWTRFDVSSILRGKFPEEKYYLEQGQTFSGKISNIFGTGVKDAQVIVLGLKHNKTFKLLTADDKGKFVVDRLSFPDSTVFVVQSRSKRGHATVAITIDPDLFPSVTSLHPFKEQFINKQMNDYFDVMSQKFHYEGGERVFHLKEVTVSAKLKQEQDDNSLYAGLGHPIRSEDLEKRFSGQSVLDIISTYPGVTVMGDIISIRGSNRNPKLVVDEMPYPQDDDLVGFLSSINAEDVEYVNLLKGNEVALAGLSGGSSGAIILRFKTGFDLAKTKPASPGLVIIRPLGYYVPTQFFSPKYVTAEQKNNPNPDFRTTIYWNPSLLISRFRPANVTFYTADRPGFYTIVAEGITAKGEPVHLEKKIRMQ